MSYMQLLNPSNQIDPAADYINYRGYEFEIHIDKTGDCLYTTFGGNRIYFGIGNFNYKQDIEAFVDRKLDVISEFSEYPEMLGAELRYFNNGGYRDIKLTYKGRIIKCYLIAGKINKRRLIQQACDTLHRSGLLED